MEKPESDQERFERYRKKLVAIIRNAIPDCKIYLFGSRARKTHRPGADIDIALDAGQPICMDILLTLYGEIEETTIPVNVDLVDMHNISDDMLAQIQAEKITWAA